MPLKTIKLNDHIASEVKCEVSELFKSQTGIELRDILRKRGVLVFKELHLSGEQQVELASLMGAVREEGVNGIFKISLDKKANARGDYLKGSFLWHMDGTHDTVPVFASLLTGVKLSNVGGQTEFANSYAAYDMLPQQTKERISTLRVIHSVETSMRSAGIAASAENLKYWRSIPDRTHKLVWAHESGRKSLVIGCHASHIEGMSKEESRTLLDELIEWTTQAQFVYRHEWSPGDLLIWDNTGVLHRAEPYSLDSGREMNRTTLLGEEAFS